MAENRLKFDRMIRLSEQGDERAIQELKSYIRRSAPYANKNLRALEQADLTDYAYGRAMTYLESETLSRSFSGATRNRELSDMIVSFRSLCIIPLYCLLFLVFLL